MTDYSDYEEQRRILIEYLHGAHRTRGYHR